jgi:hypothetical protein
MMQHSDDSDGHDLEFTSTVDESVKQNVPTPPPTNNVLDMIRNSQTNQSAITSGPMQQQQQQPSTTSYTPSYSGLSFLNSSSHPTACLFHILFKALAFAIYLLGSKFMEDIMVTVTCILFAAADFWVVKNITGRLLVGLRWWNKVDPVTGATSWIFESAVPTSEQGSNVNPFDSKFFWMVLYITPLLWIFFCVTAILWLQFQCFVTLATALVLSGSNVYGYYKCSADQRQKVAEWMDQGVQMGMSAAIRNGMLGRLGGMFGGGGGGAASNQQPNIMPGTFA